MNKWEQFEDVRDTQYTYKQEARKHRRARTERRELAQARKAAKV
jgi:hypothetical protein